MAIQNPPKEDTMATKRNVRRSGTTQSIRQQFEAKLRRFSREAPERRELAPLWKEIFGGDDEILNEGYAFLADIDRLVAEMLEQIPAAQHDAAITAIREQTAFVVASSLLAIVRRAAWAESQLQHATGAATH